MSNDDQQTLSFRQSEGDAWFERNRLAIESSDRFHECELLTTELQPFCADINDVLEIGCGDGRKTELLSRFFGARAAGIDPSQKAIDHGRARLAAQGTTEVTLHLGTADKLDWPDGSFELVYFGFCLYLVGRAELLAAIAEASRVLRPGGFLVILDFDPSHPHRREYHHRPGLFSYKQDYAALFTASGLFHLFGKRSFSHAHPHFSRDPDERVAMSFLYKEADPYSLRAASRVAA
jgi:ubiquinone/menaquinone biosynthesis C-methylase UbiE